jgi:hypothetical protein
MYEFEKQKLYNYLGKDLVDLFKEHGLFIAGGIITSIFCNRDINDIDVYFKSQKQMTDFYEDIWGSRMWITFHTKKSSIIKIGKEKVIQLIHFDTFKTAREIFNKFDFTVCMGAFDFEKEEFILHEDFLKHNSQRVLKFNRNTEFPLISVLRLHKYKEKGYEISRAETLKMLLTCANLNISSYEELFNQVSAMSEGENLEDIVDINRPFDMMDVLEQISNHDGKDKTFAKSLPFENLDELLISVTSKNYKPQYIKIKEGNYLRLFNRKLRISDAKNISPEYLIDANEYFKGYKFYKFVKKQDNKYLSYYDNNFEYKLGEEVKPTNGNNGAIFCATSNSLRGCMYHGNTNSVAIELQINSVDDIKNFNSNTSVQLNRCKFIREVPKQEWENYNKKENNLDEISF